MYTHTQGVYLAKLQITFSKSRTIMLHIFSRKLSEISATARLRKWQHRFGKSGMATFEEFFMMSEEKFKDFVNVDDVMTCELKNLIPMVQIDIIPNLLCSTFFQPFLADRIFKIFDQNNDGMISLYELNETTRRIINHDGTIKFLFAICDANGKLIVLWNSIINGITLKIVTLKKNKHF